MFLKKTFIITVLNIREGGAKKSKIYIIFMIIFINILFLLKIIMKKISFLEYNIEIFQNSIIIKTWRAKT